MKELQNHVKHVTAPYKYPRIIEFVDALPKTISGKIRRVEIRERDKQLDRFVFFLSMSLYNIMCRA